MINTRVKEIVRKRDTRKNIRKKVVIGVKIWYNFLAHLRSKKIKERDVRKGQKK